MDVAKDEDWVEEEIEEESIYPPDYDVIASPNDFNISTLYDYINKGTLEIPLFQRNFVWDIKRASKFIESIIMGLPIPQIFLHETGKDKFGVIDGQQRLMTIYYFKNKKFPVHEKLTEIRKIFDEDGRIPESILSDSAYFTEFTLHLNPMDEKPNRLNGKNYSTLTEKDRNSLDLRTIRTVIIRQIKPVDDQSVIYEIFSRLNSGGVNLRPQEIRISLYNSEFLNMLSRVNLDKRWRRLTRPDPDLHMRDVEMILRGFAMLIEGDNYKKTSMVQFLNDFTNKARKYSNKEVEYLKNLFEKFLEDSSILPENAFVYKGFNPSLYEAVFSTVCKEAYSSRKLDISIITTKKLEKLKDDNDFKSAIEKHTTDKKNVDLRLERAKKILLG